MLLSTLVAALAAFSLLLCPVSSAKADAAAVAVSASGIGEVCAKTPFTQQAIAAALPGFKIVKTTDGLEDMSWTAFLAEQDGLGVLIGPGEGNAEREKFRRRVVKNANGLKTFFMEGGSGWVGYLKVTGPRGATVTGVKVGQKFSDVYGESAPITGALSAANCFAGMEQLQDSVLCSAPELGNVILQFQADNGEIPELAEPSFRKKLNSWTLRTISLRFASAG